MRHYGVANLGAAIGMAKEPDELAELNSQKDKLVVLHYWYCARIGITIYIWRECNSNSFAKRNTNTAIIPLNTDRS